jgi:hypothetical protein
VRRAHSATGPQSFVEGDSLSVKHHVHGMLLAHMPTRHPRNDSSPSSKYMVIQIDKVMRVYMKRVSLA